MTGSDRTDAWANISYQLTDDLSIGHNESKAQFGIEPQEGRDDLLFIEFQRGRIDVELNEYTIELLVGHLERNDLSATDTPQGTVCHD